MEPKARKKLSASRTDGFGGLPVCIAKTQYSLSDDAKALNRPRDFTLTVTDASPQRRGRLRRRPVRRRS